MKTIHFLANKEAITNYALAPVRANKKKLQARGYKVSIHYSISDKLLDCDIACFISKPTQSLLGDPCAVYQESGPMISFLKKANKRAGKIVWMDNSDSTSVTHFELMPFVDCYLKKQVFKNKDLYTKPLYGGRIFSDYYHEHFGIDDEATFDQFSALQEKDHEKLKVSWNIGLGDMKNAFALRVFLHRYFPDFFHADYDVPFIKPDIHRPVDVFLRTSANLGRASVAFHRQETLRQLSELITRRNDLSGMVGDVVSRPTEASQKMLPEVGGRLSTDAYRNIVTHTKIAPSPFGWGEIGVRDYEAFIYGSLLLKPDMAHMETWPDIFIPNETYVPFDWGFTDLEQRIDEILANDKERLRIATNGQEAYRASISESGMDAFCDWFLGQIGESQ